MRFATQAWSITIQIWLAAYACIALAEPQVLGETAKVHVPALKLHFLARIDTGARITSIHAMDIHIDDESADPKVNIGKKITFTTFNEQGTHRKSTQTIVDYAIVRNAHGVEYRYVVELEVAWHDVVKTIKVNLRDRSHMHYKLLIGRNWLRNDFLVDISQAEGLIYE